MTGCMRVWCMRTGITITLKPADSRRLKALAGDRNAPHKPVWRAEIVLFSADGVGTNGIMRRTGKSKTCVWRWQERFMQEGYGGLLRDKTRPSRIPLLGSDVAERVVRLTQTDPPAEATHWTSALPCRRPIMSRSRRCPSQSTESSFVSRLNRSFATQSPCAFNRSVQHRL